MPSAAQNLSKNQPAYPFLIQKQQLEIDHKRVSSELKKLATISDAKLPAVTRVLYTDKDLKAREFMISLFKEAGLTIRVDAIGNTFARWEGRDKNLPAVATGSHIDAIPESGQFDGTVGVLGALEAVRSLKKSDFEPERSIEIIMFTAEEPTRFGIGCLGSRMMEGSLKPDEVCKLKDDDGNYFDDVRKAAGFKGDLSEVALKRNTYSHFIEMHIEQGPLLERENEDIGVVTAIAAPSTVHISLNGEGGHAGAVLMHERNDTSCAAAEITLMIENHVKEMGGVDTVGTTGVFKNGPGAVNSIPRKSFLGIDVRDIRSDRRDDILAAIATDAQKICNRRGVRYEWQTINKDYPAQCAPKLIQILYDVSNSLGFKTRKMISRAYHDCLFIAHKVPSSMIFIPCYKGYSHRPDEYSSPEQLKKGVAVLAGALRKLASE